ncbi:hypothetical protein HU200_017260 [Digitaria exilis]|uniref:YbaK/aminoacyl-tRNA synthetase-associated domain-containing protein n=1 Tax=Digitaria exilis TaxID=1010633 RepID=A0A835KGE7_9POAL|nr:hypothetical protein HU200_017260 [Digitaria exilis]
MGYTKDKLLARLQVGTTATSTASAPSFDCSRPSRIASSRSAKATEICQIRQPWSHQHPYLYHHRDTSVELVFELKIDFTCYDHPVVLTVEEQAKYVGHLGGALSKNLLLKDKKHRLYVVSALAGTKVDMKILSRRLGLGKGGLRMAPEENLLQVLQVPLGCVTPFALINESASAVSLLLDEALSSSNLDKFLNSIGKQPAYVNLELAPAVGKDSPPDLAHLVPSGVPNSSEQSVDKVTSPNVPHPNNIPKETAKEKCLVGLTFLLGESEPFPYITPRMLASSKSFVLRSRFLRKVKAKPKVQNKGAQMSQNKVDKPTDGTSVDKFVNDVFDIISPFLSEKLDVKKEELPSIIDSLRGRTAPDLESRTTILKNASYTSGFHAGFETMLNRGLNGRASRN